MKNYVPLDLNKAYRLLNTGSLVIVSSFDENKKPNLAPIAWNCPVDYDTSTLLLIVCSKNHKTYSNTCKTRKAAIIIPHYSQSAMVASLGAMSGNEHNKILELNIDCFFSQENGFAIPQNVIGFMECELHRIVDEGDVSVLFFRVLSAMVDSMAFDKRLLSELEAGKTLHHLGNKIFISPGSIIKG